MRDSRRISPIQAFLGQLLLFSIMVGLTVLSLNLRLVISIALFLIAMVIVSISNYLVILHPRVSLEDQKKKTFVKRYLQLVINDFERNYGPEYDIRVNVMVPYKSLTIGLKRGILPIVSIDSYLQIWSLAGGGEESTIESHEGGRSDETKLAWNLSPPEGNCGRAYVNRQIRTAGRNNSEDDWADEELTGRQTEATQQVISVLSAPIRKPNTDEPIAVLNIDASIPIDETDFTDESVKRYVAENYAEPIGTIL